MRKTSSLDPIWNKKSQCDTKIKSFIFLLVVWWFDVFWPCSLLTAAKLHFDKCACHAGQKEYLEQRCYTTHYTSLNTFYIWAADEASTFCKWEWREFYVLAVLKCKVSLRTNRLKPLKKQDLTLTKSLLKSLHQPVLATLTRFLHFFHPTV